MVLPRRRRAHLHGRGILRPGRRGGWRLGQFFDRPALVRHGRLQRHGAPDYSSGTVRWLSSPHVYVDVRAHDFAAGKSVPAEWVEQVVAQVPRFLSRWTGGALTARSVTVGTTPPAAGTPGTLVIAFDENPSRYPRRFGGRDDRFLGSGGCDTQRVDSAAVLGLTGDAAAFSRQAVLGHELGHAVGLAHMDGPTSSMMNSVVRTPEPTAFDVAAGALLTIGVPARARTTAKRRAEREPR